jgi:nitrite reductase/ring-hydroxylating ferredoxin subunit/DMSO/TMAO reductase YedYZ heme-binding membrane subunit
MSHSYKAVSWNRNKLIYDGFLLAAIAVYLLLFIKVAPLLSPSIRAVDVPILRMRAYGSCSFLLLTLVLSMGPLARLDPRFLALLYNRRHFGVITALVALSHASAVLDWYFAYAPIPRLQALFTANTSFHEVIGFPFEYFGIFALLVLVVMAATSHDFWLNFFMPRYWKTLHMLVYAAYAAVVLHVSLGALATGGNPVLTVTVATSLALLVTLHVLAGGREVAKDSSFGTDTSADGWALIGDLADLAEGRALIGAGLRGERIAVFKSSGKLSALSNVCSHQGGPVGEGKVVRGLVTCPWHGYMYRLEDGCSPPPFKERIRKYRVRLEGTRIWVDPVALPLGTVVEPLVIPANPGTS